MTRGKHKLSGFHFQLRLKDGSRMEWDSHPDRSCTDAEIAAAIRRYLYPFVERIESAQSNDAVDPHVSDSGTPTPHEQ